MNPLEMFYLGHQLDKSGFNSHYLYYQSILKTTSENASVLHEKINKLNLPDLHIIAHSLGGLVTMHLLDQFDDLPEGRVLMLGSPIKGSCVAQKIQKWPFFSSLLANSMPASLSGENIPVWCSKRDWGMIAGTRSQGLGLIAGRLPGKGDGTVLLEETIHPKQIARAHVSCSHTGMLFSREVVNLCRVFLETGHF